MLRLTPQTAILGAAGILTAYLLVANYGLRRTVEELRGDVTASVAALEVERSANKSARDAAQACAATNKAIIDGIAADLEAATAKVDEARAEAARLRGVVDMDRRERAAIYASDETAAAWGRTPIPPRIADRMRQ